MGYTTDCGVAVVSRKGDLKFRTEDEGPGKKGDYQKEADAVGGWKSDAGRIFIRKNFRNNPSEPRACGILNGMPEAMHYVRTGEFEVEPFDVAIAYSDGIGDIVFKEDGDIRGEFAELIRNTNFRGLEVLCRHKIRAQGTLVLKR